MSNDFVVDFSDVEMLSFDPVPAGQYLLSVVEATPGTSNSGNPKIDVQWTVIEGEHQGRRIFDTLSLHPKAQWRAKKTLTSLGLPADFKGNLDEIADFLQGVVANATVTVENSTQVDASTGEPYPPRNRITKITSAEDLDLAEAFE